MTGSKENDMTKTLLLVESKPLSAEHLDDYHQWHEQIHIPEMLEIDGFRSARRWQVEDGESYLTLYESDTDTATARANLRAALQEGRMSKPSAVEQNPPPVMRFFDAVSDSRA
jgi:hypothetical protein